MRDCSDSPGSAVLEGMWKTLGLGQRECLNIVIRALKATLLGVWKLILLESYVNCGIPAQEISEENSAETERPWDF